MNPNKMLCNSTIMLKTSVDGHPLNRRYVLRLIKKI